VKLSTITPKFVEFIPEQLDEGILYISEKHGTAIHRCCCGCGEEVVTPLNPADWQLRKSGNTVSLTPSIGNWNYSCKSHYWIRRNAVEWAASMSEAQIQHLQVKQRNDKVKYLAGINAQREEQKSWFVRLWNAIARWFKKWWARWR
jgi:hypothetical protein